MLKPNQYNLFYNTINVTNPDLAHYKAVGATQQEMVYQYFQREKRSTTARAARELSMNLNSARRCVTNLFKEGKLRKTEEKVIEFWGKANFIYQLA